MVKKTGTASADKIYGGGSFDELFGLKGNDHIMGQGGDDYLDGGDGADKVDGGAGNDRVYGGLGNDFVIGNAGDDLLFGGADKDYLFGGTGRDTLRGGTGDDRLVGGSGKADGDGGNTVYGDEGNDTVVLEQHGLVTTGQKHVLDGGAGNDTLHVVAPGQILSSQDEWGTPGDMVVQLGFGSTGVAKIHALSDIKEVTNEVEMGTMTGFENITVGKDTQIVYTGSDAKTQVSVTGGDQTDVFWFGDGNETIIGGTGDANFYNIDADRVGPDGNLGRDVVSGFRQGIDHFTVLDLPPEEGFVFKQREAHADGHGGLDTIVNIFGPGGNQIQELVLLEVTGMPNIQTTSNDWWS